MYRPNKITKSKEKRNEEPNRDLDEKHEYNPSKYRSQLGLTSKREKFSNSEKSFERLFGNYEIPPWDYIDLPCSHFIYYGPALKSAELNKYSFISCVRCQAKYDAIMLLEHFHEESPDPKILKNSYKSNEFQDNTTSCKKTIDKGIQTSVTDNSIKKTSINHGQNSASHFQDEYRCLDENVKEQWQHQISDSQHSQELPEEEMKNRRLSYFSQARREEEIPSRLIPNEGRAIFKDSQEFPIPAPRLTKIDGFEIVKKAEKDIEQKGYERNSSMYQKVVTTNSMTDTVLFCQTCCKVIAKDVYDKHSQCQVLPLDQTLQHGNLQYKHDKKCMEDLITNELKQVDIYEGNINASKTLIQEVTRIFGQVDNVCNVLKQEGKTLHAKIQSMDVQKTPENYAELVSQGNSYDSLKKKQDEWSHNANKQIPKWLLSPWLKHSFAMVLFEAKTDDRKVYTQLNNQNVFSQIEMEGNCILQHKYTRCQPNSNSVILASEVVQTIFDDENLVFLKITQGDKDLERVVVRLNLDSFWGRQFRDMCTGVLGRSFANCIFFRNSYKNQKGHHLWTGDYSDNDGSGGKCVLQPPPTQEELTYSPSPIVPGLLASRFGHKDTSTIFRIYVKESDSQDKFAFGQIVENMHALTYIAELNDVTKCLISNAGRIIKLH